MATRANDVDLMGWIGLLRGTIWSDEENGREAERLASFLETLRAPAPPGILPPHECFVEECAAVVPASMLLRGPHWKLVPMALQREVYKHYRKGQTIETASEEWKQAARKAIRSVNAKLREMGQ